jgi:hypothetical protein
MPPTLTAEDGTATALVQHRGKLLQVFQAPWTRILERGGQRPEIHLHVQEVGGGNTQGQILPLDHPLAEELAAFHPEVKALAPTQASLDALASMSSVGAPAPVHVAAPEVDYDKLAAALIKAQAAAAPPAPPEVSPAE